MAQSRPEPSPAASPPLTLRRSDPSEALDRYEDVVEVPPIAPLSELLEPSSISTTQHSFDPPGGLSGAQKYEPETMSPQEAEIEGGLSGCHDGHGERV